MTNRTNRPHPLDGGVVGTYVHAYDVPRRHSYQPIPSGRTAQDPSAGASATPIYDELCAEYVRAFRACPGDRSGEEDLGFVAFSSSPHDTGAYGIGTYGTGTYGTRHGTPQHATGHLTAQHGHSATAETVWQQVARQARGMHPVPALPPAPRRGL
ncbi:hypothetical protein ACFZAR_17170 [Streptomyces sp. NPDC008222]|uniref:hypothetical protein n=1 Tax=Streptomyces sp. NPDC008222 TaxID=3364820 RepID=UPI0036EB7317